MEDNTLYVNVRAVAFDDSSKWKFWDGGMTFYAIMADADFKQKVLAGIVRICPKDLLKVKLEISQRFQGSEIKNDFTILRVVSYTPWD